MHPYYVHVGEIPKSRYCQLIRKMVTIVELSGRRNATALINPLNKGDPLKYLSVYAQCSFVVMCLLVLAGCGGGGGGGGAPNPPAPPAPAAATWDNTSWDNANWQ